MNIGRIYDTDVANGPGMRISVFVSGCRHHCKGCFNECAWDFAFGTAYTEDTERKIIALLDKPYMKGLTILGGEPLEPENQAEVLQLIQAVRAKFGFQKTIWLYTGFALEDLNESRADTQYLSKILANIDVLVDGPFVEEEKDVTLRFRGSRNQRILELRDK